MFRDDRQFDAIVVGASIAGCTTATLLARAGARVALVEKHADPQAYKTVCTHYIQASATPVIERLGLAGPIEAAGGIRNGGEIWTRYGWIREPSANGTPQPYGYSIRRSKLDPMLRELAASAGDVELLLGETVVDVVDDGDRVAGVRTRGRKGAGHELRAPLVVAADGRGSTVGKLARVSARVKPHGRIAFFAYYEDLPLETGTDALMWLDDPDVAYGFPMDDGVTLMAAMPTKRRLPEFREDAEAALQRSYEHLPRAPRLAEGRRISKVLGRVDMTNAYRPWSRPGLGFAGDAMLAADPLWGVGCGWAFQSGAWLADAVAPALVEGGDVEAGLRRYRRRHLSRLLDQHLLLSDFASGRRFNLGEKLLFAGAARDEELARRFHAYGRRLLNGREFLTPATFARAAWAVAAHREPLAAP